MKSRPYAVPLVLGLAAAVLAFGLWRRPPNEPNATRPTVAPTPPALEPSASLPNQPSATVPDRAAATPAPAAPPTAPAVDAAAGTPVVGPVATSLATGAVAPTPAAQIDVARVRHMISDYHTLTGENPVGTNAEIMKQVMGGNPRQATLGPPEGMTLNGQGELVDQWGSPIFFHQLSKDKMEVRSAGPDRVMWTSDDVLAR